jgi:hypothetical protein
MSIQLKTSVWEEPPQMCCGAPMPAVLTTELDLYFAYIISGLGEERYAVVKFHSPMQHIFGYPNDEAFGGHPLSNLNIQHYAFNVIDNSPYINELSQRNSVCFPGTNYNFKHWVVPLHDETLEVICDKASYVGEFSANSATEALVKCINT